LTRKSWMLNLGWQKSFFFAWTVEDLELIWLSVGIQVSWMRWKPSFLFQWPYINIYRLNLCLCREWPENVDVEEVVVLNSESLPFFLYTLQFSFDSYKQPWAGE
jgi:hypothetical protein